MPNEITVRSNLAIVNGDLEYSSRPAAFQADQAVAIGPTPGTLLVSTNGIDIDLSELTTPGMARFQNLSTANIIDVGRFDPDSNKFYPFLKLKPGESYIVRLSEHITEEYLGTGTGTTSSATTLRAKARNAASRLLVEAFND